MDGAVQRPAAGARRPGSGRAGGVGVAGGRQRAAGAAEEDRPYATRKTAHSSRIGSSAFQDQRSDSGQSFGLVVQMTSESCNNQQRVGFHRLGETQD